MIEAIIRWSLGNRFFVLLATLILVGMGLFAVKNTPVDAIPDLSDIQVIIKTSYPGQAPQVVEDQRVRAVPLVDVSGKKQPIFAPITQALEGEVILGA